MTFSHPRERAYNLDIINPPALQPTSQLTEQTTNIPNIEPGVLQTRFSGFSKHRPSGPMLSISRNVRPSVCLFTFEVPFTGLFAPTSRSRMSNILRDSESLGKSNGKKWSQIWTFLFENCLKSPRKKSFFLHFFRSSSVFGLF